MLNQTRISHFIEGNNEESLCPLHVKIQMFRYSVIVLGNSSSHFLEGRYPGTLKEEADLLKKKKIAEI